MSILHVYAFGSLTRGDIEVNSDIDLLAVTTGRNSSLNPATFSIYSHRRLKEIWLAGNPFAWHLHLEAKPVFFSDGNDFVDDLGSPAKYQEQVNDCIKFLNLFRSAMKSLELNSKSSVFDLSSAFLGLRNFSSCYLLGQGRPNFSRNVALELMGDSPPISIEDYRILERSRVLCTRGLGQHVTKGEAGKAVSSLKDLEKWMQNLLASLTK